MGGQRHVPARAGARSLTVQRTIGMRMAILASGTRGDIQPKLAPGEELQRRGIRL